MVMMLGLIAAVIVVGWWLLTRQSSAGGDEMQPDWSEPGNPIGLRGAPCAIRGQSSNDGAAMHAVTGAEGLTVRFRVDDSSYHAAAVRARSPRELAADGIYRGGAYTETPEDERFNAAVAQHFGERMVFSYYSTVAGTKHRNRDRTSRARIIRECLPGEVLHLVPEPENPYDAKAMAVLRADGSQLGYIPARSAAEMEVGRRRRGEVWTAVLRRHTLHPETGAVVGAVILLICLAPDGNPKNALPCTAEVNA